MANFQPLDRITIKTGLHRAWDGYVLGVFSGSIANGQPADRLVRVRKGNLFDVERVMVMDLVAGGNPIPVDLQPFNPREGSNYETTIFLPVEDRPMRRPGLWVANGNPGNVTQMYSWHPGAITCIFDHLGPNMVLDYHWNNPSAPIIIRFQHPLNWQQDPTYFANQLGRMVASKWNDIKVLDPYIYFANEVNLHYENGDPDLGRQYLYESQEFYQKYAEWVRLTADVIKQTAPEMRLVCPPFAFGHHEDGAPDDNGNPKEGWAGYDYLAETIKTYFDKTITFHAYWGNAGGSNKKWLYDPEESSWYAFRWQRVLNLFKKRYSIDARVIIDEAGNFGVKDSDFTDQVIYYANQCLRDERVIALTYFLWSDQTNSPGNLPNSWAQGIPDLATHVARLKAMPDVVIDGAQPTPPPPIVVIPPPQPDVTTQQLTIKEKKEAKKGVLPLLVGNWWRNGVKGKVTSPSGQVVNFTTGDKQGDFGPGGWSAEYCRESGIYRLELDGAAFNVETDGKQFIKMSYTAGAAAESVRLISKPIGRTLADSILTELELDETTRGVFKIEAA